MATFIEWSQAQPCHTSRENRCSLLRTAGTPLLLSRIRGGWCALHEHTSDPTPLVCFERAAPWSTWRRRSKAGRFGKAVSSLPARPRSRQRGDVLRLPLFQSRLCHQPITLPPTDGGVSGAASALHADQGSPSPTADRQQRCLLPAEAAQTRDSHTAPGHSLKERLTAKADAVSLQIICILIR